ncbi:MAG: AAA family ATPase [Elusimicrobia bacterium]|nr:AAA family ATPase [Elusimicrobiota bacterium]
MYLKALEIIGFKSFADKARFDLQRGMTGIVGPNGCGKSNVVDSIRWCIGEMSWKSLRTGSMMGILFDGSQKRPPMNMAEVTMVFDNESRRLPIDFTEVTVTRKLFRSGESEYYLNKVQCRLRDIKDLFMDTGIGGEGYAIIDQGGVEFVLSAKPEQRRELFEEAAGVSKYKAKRDEALRKLERVDADLARLMDSVVLIEEQIKKLDSEARKARTYQKYREELKASELALAVAEITQHQAEADKANEELEPVKRDLFDRNTQITAAEGELAAINLALAEKQAAAAKCSEEIAAATHKVGSLEGEIKRCADLAEEMRRQIKASEEEDATAWRRMAELEPALNSLSAKIEEAAAQLAPVQANFEEKHAQLAAAEAALVELAAEQDSRNSELVRLTQAEIEASSKTAGLSSGIAHDENDLASTAKELDKAEQDLQQKRAAVEQLKASLSEQKGKVEAARQALAALETARTELLSKKDAISALLLAAKSAEAAANAKLELARAQGGKDPYWLGTQAVLNANMPGVGGTLRSRLTIKDEHKVFAEEALGRFIDSVICDTFATAEAASDLVGGSGRARCRFIALEAVPQQPQNPALENFKTRISYPPELENLVSAVVEDCRVEGTKLRGKFWMTGGSPDVSSPEQYWAQEKDALADLDKSRAEIASLEAQLSACAGESAKNEGDISLSREQLQTESLKENSIGGELNAAESARLSLEEMSGLIRQERTRLEAQKAEKNAALEEAQARLQEHKNARAAITAALEELAARKTSGQARAAELKETEAEIQSSLNNLRMRQVELESDRRNLISERDSLNAAASRRKAQREDFSSRALEHEENRLSAQSQLQQQRDALGELERADKTLREEMVSVKAGFDEKSEALTVMRGDLSQLKMREHDLEALIKNHAAVKEDAVRRLQEEWQTTYEEAKEKYADTPVDHERVKMLRRRIENMGAINMTAPEEYDALSARDQFLKCQINYLNQAKADLKSAINRINATTRENFRHIFQQVRDHFQRIYQTLFVGGEANLILTQPDNLLETGVEIMAQPPGKKLQNIAALSGGEKALTALALLFSFFCVNPSPFCVMDEADAPLDEANVERFVNLLREFSSQTQFLVVTHNKRTMEAADVLYGVTMEESGVSKVISVGLNARKN